MDGRADAAGGEVLILGAGFSRAMSRHLPLTDELGDLVRDQLRDLQPSRWLPDGPFENGYFEAWLSSLAEDQPDLDDGDNEERHALFTRSIEVTRSILLDRSNLVIDGGPLPDWLRRLVWLAHVGQLTLITFNYDTGIEAAVDAASFYHWLTQTEVRRYDVLQHLPPRPFAWRSADKPPPTFNLLKLHGSVDWYWVMGDRTGATIQWQPDDRPPGLAPFLTPPTASKSAFYANPISRELWQRAGEALDRTARVVLIGYSLPVTDLTVSGMLQRHIDMGRTRLVVVNREPAPVVDRLVRLGASHSRIEEIGGDDAVARYVDQLEQRVAQGLLASLRARPLEALPAPLVIGPHIHARIVDDIHRTPSGPRLVLSKHASPLGLLGRADADPGRPPPGRTMHDLLAVNPGPGETLTAVLPDGKELTIIAHDAIEFGEIIRSHMLTASTGFAHLGPIQPAE